VGRGQVFEQARVGRGPGEEGAGRLAGRGVVEANCRAQEGETFCGLGGGDAHRGDAHPLADRGGQLAERDALVRDRVQAAAGRGGLQGQPVGAGRVERVDGRPAVGAVADVGRRAGLPGDGDQDVREAVVVERAVHDRRQPDGGRPYAAFGQPDHVVLGVGPRTAGGGVGLGAGPPGDAERDEHERARGADERLARPFERRTERFDGGEVGGDRVVHPARAHEVVLEGEVDDAVGRRGGLAQPVEVVEVTAPDLGTGGLQRLGGAIGTREAHDLVSGPQQLGDDCRAHVPGRTRDENTHENSPERLRRLPGG
jgi:hypothetical protein